MLRAPTSGVRAGRLLALIGLSAVFGGCTLVRATYVAAHSPAELPRFEATPIRAEAGAEPIASRIAAGLDEARSRIESTHGAALDHPPLFHSMP